MISGAVSATISLLLMVWCLFYVFLVIIVPMCGYSHDLCYTMLIDVGSTVGGNLLGFWPCFSII